MCQYRRSDDNFRCVRLEYVQAWRYCMSSKTIFLKLAFIIIVHKSQSLTFFKTVIFLSRKNIDFTNVYVVLSKIRNYNDFTIKKSFFHDVFSKIILSKIIIRLKNDYLRRSLDYLIKQLSDFKNIKAKQKIKTKQKIKAKQKKRIRSETPVVKDFENVLDFFPTYFESSSYESLFVNFSIVISDDSSSSSFLNFLILIKAVRNLSVEHFESNMNCQLAERKLFETLINRDFSDEIVKIIEKFSFNQVVDDVDNQNHHNIFKI